MRTSLSDRNHPTRILHIICDMTLTGAPRQLMELCKGLDQGRYDVTVCSLYPYWDRFDEYAVPGIQRLEVYKKPGLDFSVLPRLVRAMRAGRYTVVHTWGFTASAWGRLAAVLAGVRVIVISPRNTAEWRNLPRHMVNLVLAPFTSIVVTNAQAVRESDARTMLIRPRYRVIYNGINSEVFKPVDASRITEERQALGLPDGPLIGTLGRLAEQKDYPTWLRTARRVLDNRPDARFVILGGGKLQPQIEQLVADLRLSEAVTMLGVRADVTRIIPLFDVLLLTSRWEGFPNVVMEAMACEVPPVATRVSGIPELVIDGETGFLAPAGDVAALAEAVLRLIQDPALARRMGRAGRLRIQESFSLSRMVAEYSALYEELTRRSG